jgi:hypothetical protein
MDIVNFESCMLNLDMGRRAACLIVTGPADTRYGCALISQDMRLSREVTFFQSNSRDWRVAKIVSMVWRSVPIGTELSGA